MSKIRLLKIFIAVAIVAVIFISAGKQIRSSPSKGDVDIYLNASRLFLAGENAYKTPNRGGSDFYVYPPLLALLLAPFLALPIEATAYLWCAFNVGLIYLMLRMLFAAMSGGRFSDLPEKSRLILIFLPVLLDLRFILHHLDYGQANIFVYALAVFGLWLASKNNTFAGGASVGVSMITKLLTLPFGVFFLARKNLKIVFGIACGGISGLLAPALLIGWQRNLFYLEYWLRNVILDDARRERHWNLNINFSLQAQIARFFTDVPAFDVRGQTYSLNLLALTPQTIKYLDLAAMLIVTAAIVLYVRKFKNCQPLVSFWGGAALTFCLIPIFSPVALKHHFVALLPAYFYAVYLWHCRSLRDRKFVFFVAASFALTTLTSENFWGKDLNNFFLASGFLVWGTLFLAAAIWRAANCQRRSETNAFSANDEPPLSSVSDAP